MTDNHTLSVYRYNTWANTRLLDHLRQLPEDTCRTIIKSVFPSIFDTLLHIYIIDRGWYAILTKEYSSDDYEAIRNSVNNLIADSRDLSLEQLDEKQHKLAVQFEDFIAMSDMSERHVYSGVTMGYHDVITHVVNHGTYHRGNISAMLHQLGHKSIQTDYGFYLYDTVG